MTVGAAQLAIDEEQQLDLPTGAQQFGLRCDVSGDLAVATHLTASGNLARVFAAQAGGWVAEADLQPSVGTGLFGYDVAIDGERAAVGAPGHASGAGAVFLYERTNGQWSETAVVQAGDAAQTAFFGSAVDLDGERLLVGAPGLTGGVYVFVRVGGTWLEEQKLVAYSAIDGYGTAVALAGDLALATAPRHDAGGLADVGSARLFRRGPGGWSSIALLTASTLAVDQLRLGNACDLEEGLAVIGAQNAFTGATSTGAVYVFEPDAAGNWSETARLFRGGVTGLASDVALAERVVVAGARYDAFNGDAGTGSVQVFRCNETGWVHAAHVESSDASPSHGFGRCVSAAGTRVVISAVNDPGAGAGDTGACYVYSIARTPRGVPVCAGVANSTGLGATLTAHGSDVAGADALTIEVLALPPFQFGYLLAARSFALTTPGGSQGVLCLGSPTARFTDFPLPADATGRACRDVPLTQMPLTPQVAVSAGDTWYFQWWYRDVNPQPTSNFSSTIELTFQ